MTQHSTWPERWRDFWHTLTQKTVSVQRTIALFDNNAPTYSPARYQSFAVEGYEKNAYVYACLMKYMNACAGLPWGLYRRGNDGRKLVERDGALNRLLLRPNPQQSRRAWMREGMLYWSLGGHYYVHGVSVSDGRITELYNFRPDRVEIKAASGPYAALHEVDTYLYTKDSTSKPVPYSPEQILHILDPHPRDDYYGLSSMTPSSRSIDQNNASKDWDVSLLQNAARPSGALVTDSTLNDEQFERMVRESNQSDIGPRNAGHLMVLDGGMKFVSMSMNPSDMDWANGIVLSAREIAIARRTPPEMLFDTQNKVFGTYREARKAYYEEAILPDMEYFRDEINRWLMPRFDDRYEFDFDRDAIEALQDDRDALWKSVGDAWWLTIDEKRAKLGLNALPNGNVLMLPAALIAVTPEELTNLANRVLESVAQAVQGEVGRPAPQNNRAQSLDNSEKTPDNTE